MTRTNYYFTKATITNKQLIKRIKYSIFRYKGPYTYQEYDPYYEDVHTKTEEVDAHFIDLAVFFGFRDTYFKQEGDHPLSNKECEWLNEIVHKQVVKLPHIPTYDPQDIDYCSNEFYKRLIRCNIGYDIDNNVELTVEGMFYTDLFRAISVMYSGTEIKLEEYERHGSKNVSDNYYIIKYGAIIQSWCNSYDNNGVDLPPKDRHQLALYFGENKKYHKSLRILRLLKKNSAILNDIGVNYERLGKYTMAYKFYKKANSEWSLVNILRLYDNSKIDFNLSEYHQICQTLNNMGSYHGYIRESNLYHYGRQEVVVDRELSLEIASQGYYNLPKNPHTIFQYAWCLAYSSKTEQEKVRSYNLYKAIAYGPAIPDDNDLYRSAINNYAWHCLTAHGCEQNIPEAVYWFIRAFENGYQAAAEQLSIIYSTCEGYINKKIAHFWLDQAIKENENGEQ